MFTKNNLPYLLQAIASHDSDECLIWPHGGTKLGYGTVKFEGRKVYVHRLAFYLAHGHWPTPMGCHSCDRPGCFNWRHIFESDNTGNMRDAASKGRVARDERHWHTTLTVEQVRQIRADYVPGDGPNNQIGLAKKYGVCNQTISRIITRTDWRHI